MPTETISITDPAAARAFIASLVLPPPPPRPATRGGPDPDATEDRGDLGSALALGSQVTEFGAGLSPELRKDIINSFLVAQIAANSFLKDVGGGTQEWYDRFFFVLANSGWTVQRFAEETRQSSGTPEEIHRMVVPILKAVLGDAVAARSTVVAVLRGLAVASAQRPWITLFERASQRASANQFQVGYVGGDAAGAPTATLTNFDLKAEQSITQVLFFRFSETKASLKYSKATLSMNEPVFQEVKPLVEERIREQRDAFIEAVEL